MARQRPVISDLGSEAFANLVRSFNTLLSSIESAADLAALQTAVTNASGETGVEQIKLEKPLPRAPRRRLV